MMKLGTMRALVATLDTSGESPIANEILSAWEHDTGTARFLRASANFLFMFKRSGQDYVLRFNHASERTPANLHAELEYILHLATRGMHIAKPVRSWAGNFVESIPTDQGVFHAAVFEALEGEQFDLRELTPAMVMLWGETLGELHTVSQSYPGTGHPTWEDHLAMVAGSLSVNELAARTTLDQLRRRLSQLPVHDHNFGLIHFDYELDNVIWDDNQLGIIDFDDIARYWYVADIAFALRDLFDDSADKVDLKNEIFQNFIYGYRMVKGIDQEELELIPLFLKMHNLITYVKLRRAVGTDEGRDAPVWLGELRKKLLTKIEVYHDELSKHA